MFSFLNTYQHLLIKKCNAGLVHEYLSYWEKTKWMWYYTVLLEGGGVTFIASSPLNNLLFWYLELILERMSEPPCVLLRIRCFYQGDQRLEVQVMKGKSGWCEFLFQQPSQDLRKWAVEIRKVTQVTEMHFTISSTSLQHMASMQKTTWMLKISPFIPIIKHGGASIRLVFLYNH